MADLVRSKLDQKLKERLKDVDLDALCRVEMSRIVEKAIPNIGVIELVTGDIFANVYDALYRTSFPKQMERERTSLIVDRLNKEFAHQRAALAPYRVVGIRDEKGEAIGAAQFSILPLPNVEFSVPYLQYIYVRSENRRQDMSEILHMMILAITESEVAPLGRTVPFTLFECDPPGHGDNEEERAYAVKRAKIHSHGGSVAMMVRKRATDELLSPHVQPGLEIGDEPLQLVWAVKESPSSGESYDINELGSHLIAAYYTSLRDEGFPEANIQLAERMVLEHVRGGDFELMDLTQVKPHEDSE